jgi:plastocyanin
MKRWSPLPPGRALGLAVGLMLSLAVLVPPVAASGSPATYTVLVGYSEPARGVNIDAYFPDHLTVHVGDTVTFRQNTPEIHTVTFLAPGQASPNLEGPSFPVIDPQIYYPVVPAGGAYDGTSYANSGIMSTDPSYFLPGEQVTSFSLTFTKAGNYQYYCIVHGMMMSGTVYVVDASVAIPPPGRVRSEAKTTIAGLLQQVPGAIQAAEAAVPPPEHHGDGTTTYHVNVGSMSGQIDLMSFFPSKLEVHPGDTVVWHLTTVPHTVTFLNGNPEPPLVVAATWPPPSGTTPTVMFDPAILGPSATPQPPLGTTALVNSGFLADPSQPPFSLTIGDISGKVSYLCLLHDASGMKGELVVVPSE